MSVGRAFTGSVGRVKSQTMILAGSSESTATATATASWKKQGAAPAVTAEKNCAKGGVDVTATNKGDAPFRFQLSGKEHVIAPGKSETITVPVGEDQAYEITIKGEGGFTKTFTGVLDCKTAGTTPGKPSSQPSPATAGGSNSGTNGTTGGGDLAETGSSSATPVIAGVAVALVVVGGGAVFFLRKKKAGVTQ